EVGWAEHAGLERGAVARDMDQEDGLAWQHRRICGDRDARDGEMDGGRVEADLAVVVLGPGRVARARPTLPPAHRGRLQFDLDARSEEHTSELQSRGHLVCRLLLEKKKKEQYRLRPE